MIVSMATDISSIYWLAIIALTIAGSILTRSNNKNSDDVGKLGEKLGQSGSLRT